MSRGPGHLATAITEHLAAHPSREFTIGELAAIAYPGAPIEKKHRVATARALKKLAPERLKRREPPPRYNFNPLTERYFADMFRAIKRISKNGDIGTLTFLRGELWRERKELAFTIAQKKLRRPLDSRRRSLSAAGVSQLSKILAHPPPTEPSAKSCIARDHRD
jgi:hypothetical protein